MKLRVISVIGVLAATSLVHAASYDLNSSLGDKNCSTVSASGDGAPGLKIRQCQLDIQEKNPGFFVIKSQFRDLPEFVQEHFQHQKDKIKSWDNVYLSVLTENDDVALMGLCKAKDQTCVDDVGYTMGSSMMLGGVYKEKYNMQLKVGNALYSKGIGGTYYEDAQTKERFEKQNIRSVLMIEFLMDSIKQDRMMYWSAGTGIIALSSTAKFGFLDAAKQQRSMHQLLNTMARDLAVNRTNIGDGSSDAWGFYLMAGLGVQKILKDSSSGVRSRNYAQITTRLSTLAKHSELRLELGTEMSYPFGAHHRAATGVSVATTAHSAGFLNEGTVYLKLESGKSFETTVGLTCQRGKLPNFASYNIPNVATGKPDCMYRVNLKYYLQ